MLKIGNVEIQTNILLAPMSGCTDLPFRLICREHGAKFCFYEMLDANSFYHNSRRTFAMMKTLKEDTPIAAQLVGYEPRIMLGAARKILDIANISFLDINAACPARKVIKKRSGAYLLNDKSSLFSIIELLSSRLPVPITVKMRLGYHNQTQDDIVEIAKRCENSGSSAVFVHGRTRMQGYSGSVDYNSIKAIKDALKIPVIGSGDIFSPELAKKMITKTGCDGVLVARGAFGNPWIFDDINEYLHTERPHGTIDLKTKLETMRRHIIYVERFNQSRGKVGVMRKVALWYMKSFPSARKRRGEVSYISSFDNMLRYIDSIPRQTQNEMMALQTQ